MSYCEGIISYCQVALNVGAHQVRIYNGRLDVRQPLHESVSRDLK